MRLASALLLAVIAPAAARAGVAGSKHDFSVTGPGQIRAVSEGNACVFCHVPHAARLNRPDLTAQHTPYQSSTLRAQPGAPTGASRACLSCHDGTIAVGQTQTRRIATIGDTIPAGSRANLGTDLRNTHPISFRPGTEAGTHPPAAGGAVKLDQYGELQCTACHDPHEEDRAGAGRFLVAPLARSGLCLSCHDGAAVQPAGSSHAVSGAPFGPAEGNRDRFASVAEAGCLACHASHGGDKAGQLVERPQGDTAPVCLRCHSGTVTRLSIAADLAKPSSHAVQAPGVHDAGEGRPGAAAALPETGPGAPRHATCVDCHDPHAAGDAPAVGHGVGGALAGVWGIDQAGRRVEQVRFEYELCFKCHGDSANKPQAQGPRPPETVRRKVADANLREVFAASAASAHPVVVPVEAGDVPSLVPRLAKGSLIRCGDCHASDGGPGAGGTGARGPHGSTFPHLLERSYRTSPGPDSAAAYALCYKCHDRDVLRSAEPGTGSAFPLHALHLDAGAACATCHDAHGVSAQAGTATANAHLVSFDVSVVQPLGGALAYRSAGRRAGSCALTCHGQPHDPAAVPATGVYGMTETSSTKLLRPAPAAATRRVRR